MIKKNIKPLIVTSIVILLPIIAGIILWDKLPAEIPNHWNFEGEVDGWSSKPFAVIVMPLILLAIHLVSSFAMLSDPKNQEHTSKILQLGFWITPTLSILLSAVVYSTAMGGNIRVSIIIPVFLGIVFVVIGNYMPKCRQSYTIGIKLPWTLNSEENWNKTHRMASWIWVIGGLVTVIFGFLDIVWIVIPTLAVLALVPIVYSYVLYRKGI